MKPNIVLVEVDDLCYKYLGCLEADSDEWRKVAAKCPEVARRLQAEVDEWLRMTGPVLETGALRRKR
ncbi:MAG TPA: hypothetical protein VMW24_21835 [Sedimentisphaerales bacterium]|nr:hypothetical protein [Sedimentisphaerales bacterium]